MIDDTPKYKYINADTPRNPDKAFYFTVGGSQIRICKTYFENTFDITNRMIRTDSSEMDNNEFLQKDLLGKQTTHPRIEVELLEDIRCHINSIPRIESDHLRSNTSREFIDDGKTITDLSTDFKEDQI